MPRSVFATTLYAILFSSLLLSIPALVNGYPLVYPDSGTYLLQAIEFRGEINRTPYYSLFLFPFHLRMSLWPIVFAQAIFCTIFIYFVVRAVDYKRPLRFLIILTAVLGLFTSLPWFAGQIMPDVFTGLVILGVFLLAFAWDRWSSAERWFLLVGLTGILCFHPSFPPLTMLLTGFVLALNLLRGVPWRQLLRTAAVLLGPVSLAFLAMIAYSEAVIQQATILPDGPSFLLARIIADGPGAAYLRESCHAGSHYALCAYLDDLPAGSDAFDEFLWSTESPWQKAKRELSIEGARSEANDIILHAILRYPWWQIEEWSIDFARQLTMFRGIEPQLCPVTRNAEQLKSCLDGWLITKMVSRYFPSESEQFVNSLQNTNTLSLKPVYYVDVSVAVLSLIFCAVLAFRWWRPSGRPEAPFSDLLAVILVGILSNAALTGMLARPADRFGARVIWLLPFFVVLYLGRLGGNLRPANQPIS
jgi:hypothetical protein